MSETVIFLHGFNVQPLSSAYQGFSQNICTRLRFSQDTLYKN